MREDVPTDEEALDDTQTVIVVNLDDAIVQRKVVMLIAMLYKYMVLLINIPHAVAIIQLR